MSTIETVTATATAIPPTAEILEAAFRKYVLRYLNMLDHIPGGAVLLRYIKSSYRDDPIRSLIEYALIIFAATYFFSSKKKENRKDTLALSKREVDELIEEWQPAPLVEPVTEAEKWRVNDLIVKGQNSSHISILQHPEIPLVVNLASADFLDLNVDLRMKDAARQTINSAGVGACGPPNFYGSQDAHVRLEEDLARYLNTDNAILYGQDLVTAGSVIPAFLKRGDLAVVDSGVNQAIQKALIVSRCDIEWYKHNDIDHLEQVLNELQPVLKSQKPLRRRFIITEGLFAYSGELAKLPAIVALKNKYKYRLFLDESLSIGTVGKFGRGICEHYDINRDEISITIGSLANAFSSSGGFCAGVEPMIQHQRINSNAYVFSAALPPYSARVASEAIKLISSNITSDGESELLLLLHRNIDLTYKALQRSFEGSKYLELKSSDVSPIIHLGFRDDYRQSLELPNIYGNNVLLTTGKPSKKPNVSSVNYTLECYILQKIINAVLDKDHTLLNRTRIIYEQENLPVASPRLLIHVNAGVSDEELETVIKDLPLIVDGVCSRIQLPSDLETLYNEMISQ